MSDRPEHRAEERRGADVERELHRERDRRSASLPLHAEASWSASSGSAEAHDRAEADEEALHREAAWCAAPSGSMSATNARNGSMLMLMRGVENPEQPGRHPQRATSSAWRSSASELAGSRRRGSTAAGGRAGPRCGRSGDPMIGWTMRPVSGAASQSIGIWSGCGAEVLVDGAHVGHLQAPAELDAEEAEAHVPDLPEREAGFGHRTALGSRLLALGFRLSACLAEAHSGHAGAKAGVQCSAAGVCRSASTSPSTAAFDVDAYHGRR